MATTGIELKNKHAEEQRDRAIERARIAALYEMKDNPDHPFRKKLFNTKNDLGDRWNNMTEMAASEGVPYSYQTGDDDDFLLRLKEFIQYYDALPQNQPPNQRPDYNFQNNPALQKALFNFLYERELKAYIQKHGQHKEKQTTHLPLYQDMLELNRLEREGSPEAVAQFKQEKKMEARIHDLQAAENIRQLSSRARFMQKHGIAPTKEFIKQGEKYGYNNWDGKQPLPDVNLKKKSERQAVISVSDIGVDLEQLYEIMNQNSKEIQFASSGDEPVAKPACVGSPNPFREIKFVHGKDTYTLMAWIEDDGQGNNVFRVKPCLVSDMEAGNPKPVNLKDAQGNNADWLNIVVDGPEDPPKMTVAQAQADAMLKLARFSFYKLQEVKKVNFASEEKPEDIQLVEEVKEKVVKRKRDETEHAKIVSPKAMRSFNVLQAEISKAEAEPELAKGPAATVSQPPPLNTTPVKTNLADARRAEVLPGTPEKVDRMPGIAEQINAGVTQLESAMITPAKQAQAEMREVDIGPGKKAKRVQSNDDLFAEILRKAQMDRRGSADPNSPKEDGLDEIFKIFKKYYPQMTRVVFNALVMVGLERALHKETELPADGPYPDKKLLDMIRGQHYQVGTGENITGADVIKRVAEGYRKDLEAAAQNNSEIQWEEAHEDVEKAQWLANALEEKKQWAGEAVEELADVVLPEAKKAQPVEIESESDEPAPEDTPVQEEKGSVATAVYLYGLSKKDKGSLTEAEQASLNKNTPEELENNIKWVEDYLNEEIQFKGLDSFVANVQENLKEEELPVVMEALRVASAKMAENGQPNSFIDAALKAVEERVNPKPVIEEQPQVEPVQENLDVDDDDWGMEAPEVENKELQQQLAGVIPRLKEISEQQKQVINNDARVGNHHGSSDNLRSNLLAQIQAGTPLKHVETKRAPQKPEGASVSKNAETAAEALHKLMNDNMKTFEKFAEHTNVDSEGDNNNNDWGDESKPPKPEPPKPT